MSLVSSAGLCPLVVAARNGHLQVRDIVVDDSYVFIILIYIASSISHRKFAVEGGGVGKRV